MIGASATRNLRSVWVINPQPYPGAHFATFPEALVEPCIRAGTSERGACPVCGAPLVREVDVGYVQDTSHANGRFPGDAKREAQANGSGTSGGPQSMKHGRANKVTRTTGWRASCSCSDVPPVPCVVIDPFAGSGTTGMVAARLGRAFVGIDLAGGDKCLGIVEPLEAGEVPLCEHGRRTRNCHTAHDRIRAAREGRTTEEAAGARKHGQGDLLEITP